MQNEPQTREAAYFKDRRILVTGGTKGIGEAIVERLIRGGGKVITTGRSLPPGGTPDRFIQADISTREGIDQVVKAVMDRLGGLDILIHNVGIRVNAVSPGSIDTPGLNDLLASAEVGEQRSKMISDSVPLGRFGTPDEIAKAVVFLASDDASYIVCGWRLRTSVGR